MGILHGTESFSLTPEYDRLVLRWANENPDHPNPRFDTMERALLVFHWPDSDPVEMSNLDKSRTPRKSNGQFARKG